MREGPSIIMKQRIVILNGPVGLNIYDHVKKYGWVVEIRNLMSAQYRKYLPTLATVVIGQIG